VGVYRDKNSDGVYKLVGETNCTTTLLDNVADGSLGITMPTTNTTLAVMFSITNGLIDIPLAADSFGYPTLLFASHGDGPYIWLEPEDRIRADIPIKGWLFFASYNLIPDAPFDRTEGGQVGAQGGQDTGAGYGFVYGGAAFANGAADFLGGAFLTMGGGTATAGGAFSINSGLGDGTGDLNGGDGAILGGVFVHGGHYGDLTINQWRNISMTGVGPMTLTGGTGSAIRTDTTTGHTFLLQAYDNNTGPAYVTYATITNGNTPSLVISAPAGGSTINISGLDLSAAVAPASSGTRFLCISTTGVVTSSASACSGT